MGSPLAIASIIIGFLLLGGIYSLVTPILEASDEQWHYMAVKHVADGQGLAVQQPGATPENPARQEASQPPLYYLVGGLTTAWIDTGGIPSVDKPAYKENPHAQVGRGDVAANKNMVIHGDDEGFPFHGISLAVHLLRALSLLMAAGTVYVTYRVGQEVFPSRPALALGAAIVTAFNPQFLFISASVSNDNVAVLVASLTLWLLVRFAKGSAISWRLWGTLGLLLGLAGLSKLSLLGLVPLSGLLVAVLAWTRRDRSIVLGFAAALGIMAAVGAWWYLRNWQLYGDPTGLNMMYAVVGQRHLTVGQLLSELPGLWLSFWMVFGGFNILGDPWYYGVLKALLWLALIGLIVGIVRSGQGWKDVEHPWGLVLVGLWTVIVFVALLRWTSTTMGSTGRLLFPAISSISILLVLGLRNLLPEQMRPVVGAIAAALFLAVAVIAPFRTIAPAYARPRLLAAGDVHALPNPTRVRFGDEIELVGFDVSGDRDAAGRVHAQPGGQVNLTLYWRAVQPLRRDYSEFVALVDRDFRSYGKTDTYPGAGAFPTSLWPVGAIVEDRVVVPVSGNGDGPVNLFVDVGMYHWPELDYQKVEPEHPGSPTSLWVAALTFDGQGAGAAIPAQALDVPFQHGITLVGADVTGSALGDTGVRGATWVVPRTSDLSVTVYWRAATVISRNYTVYLHLFDAEGRRVAQHDGEPRGGMFPTSAWIPKMIVPDTHVLTLPRDLPAGRYQLVAGAYELGAGGQIQPLPTLAGDGNARLGDIVFGRP